MLPVDHAIKTRLRAVVRELGPRYLSGRLADIGCGDKPYQGTLKDVVSEHVGIDHPGTTHDLSNADIIASAYEYSPLQMPPSIRACDRGA